MASNDINFILPIRTTLLEISRSYPWVDTYRTIDLEVPLSWAPTLSRKLSSHVMSSLNSLLDVHRVGNVLSSQVIGDDLVLGVRVYTDIRMIQEYLGGLYYTLEDREFSLPPSFFFSEKAKSLGFYWDDVYSNYTLSVSVKISF